MPEVPPLRPLAEQLALHGKLTRAAVVELVATGNHTDALYDALRSGLTAEWTDTEAATVVRAVATRTSIRTIEPNRLQSWIEIHSHLDDRADRVVRCIEVDAPREVSVLRVLSRAGAQKVVFLADWQTRQEAIVLKRLLPGPDAAGTAARELRSHVLSMRHPNIVETHVLSNAHGERFFVEERLRPLPDLLPLPGIDEGANLLGDIASALSRVHGQERAVHCDVKPDNIATRGRSYVLLDFGIARGQNELVNETEPIGSLRTRAPELIQRERGQGTYSDVWSLGASVYHALLGHFPLYDPDEPLPDYSDRQAWHEKERELCGRIEEEWETRVFVGTACIANPLREVLLKVLDRDPDRRPTARALVELCQHDLAAYLRGPSPARLSPLEEAAQLIHLDPSAVPLMSQARKAHLGETLERLRQTGQLSDEQSRLFTTLAQALEFR